MMERSRCLLFLTLCFGYASIHAQQASSLSGTGQALRSNMPPSITIYNQDFAVIRQTLPLQLKSGVNELSFDDVTEQAEPDSVILRDPTGKHTLQVLEQNYRAETASQQLLLSLFEGQTIDFEVHQQDKTEIVKGKVIRSGYVDRAGLARRFGPGYNPYTFNQYYYNATPQAPPGMEQPLIEVNGGLRFSLPQFLQKRQSDDRVPSRRATRRGDKSYLHRALQLVERTTCNQCAGGSVVDSPILAALKNLV